MQKREGMSVPKFGGWDKKVGETNYSMVFSAARAKKKRTEGPSRFKPSPGEELLTPPAAPQPLTPPPAFYAPLPPSQSYSACVFQVPFSPKAAQSYPKNKPKKVSS